MNFDPSTIVEVVKFELHKDWVDDDSDEKIWILDVHAVTLDGVELIVRTEHDDGEQVFEEIRRICLI